MPEHVARQGDPVMVDGVPVYNAYCVWCDEIATGTFTELFGSGWLPSSAGAWNCPEHAPSPLPVSALPWRAGPNTLKAIFAPFPPIALTTGEEDDLERAA